MHLPLFSAALLLSGLVVGCGQPAATPPVQTDQVNLPPSYQFDPVVIQVGTGTTVTWTNNDHFTHSVKLQDGPDHVIKPGENVSIPFDTAGEYTYICTFHAQNMKGKVIVGR